MASSTGKGGRRKIGRGLRSPASKRYASEGRRLTNKIKKLKKHIKSHNADKSAMKVLKLWGYKNEKDAYDMQN